MAADQQFAERIRRIQSGKQWQPEGVVMGTRARAASSGPNGVRQAAGQAFRRLVLLVGVLLLAGAGLGLLSLHTQFTDVLASDDHVDVILLHGGVPVD